MALYTINSNNFGNSLDFAMLANFIIKEVNELFFLESG